MLSERARRVLGLIAEGRSYDQILQQHPELTYFDIFAAAREALDLRQQAPIGPTPEEIVPFGAPDVLDAHDRLDDGPAPARPKRLPSYIERARATHRRAWARWTREEDARLTSLFQQGQGRAEMVQALGRHPGAIKSRLVKLGLISEAEGENAPPDDLGPGEAVQEAHVPSRPADGRDRVERNPSLPVVQGWDLFRHRLTDDLETS